MIQNDQELVTMQDRIVYFQSILAQLRVTASAEEFPLVSGGYQAEVEKMQSEVKSYLMRHVNEPVLAS